MSTIVLVHGGGHGAWCWEPLMSRLETPSLAIDLPGRGRRPLPLEEATPEVWADCVIEAIERNDLRDVLLVGHSMGGLTILRVAARIPERLRRLVFIASPVPRDGQSLAQLMSEEFGPQSAENVGRPMAPEQAAFLFTQDLSPDRARWLLDRLVPDSPLVFGAPLSLTDLLGPTPRTYVRTARDYACPPSFQDRAIALLQPVEVVELDEGHSVMISNPNSIAKMLDARA